MREIRRRRGEEERVDPVEDAAVAEQQPSGVLRPEVAFNQGLEQVAERGRGDDHRAEGQRAPRVREHGLLVDGDERREDACRGADDEAFPRLARRDDRRHLVPAGDPSSDVGECVRDEDGEEDRDERQPAVGVELAHEEQVSEAEADPRSAEDRRRDCDRRRLPCLRHRREDEAEDEREQEAGDHPVRAGDLRAAERRQRTAVAGEDEGPQWTGEAIELVEGDQPSHRDQREEEPAPEIGAAEDDRETGRHDGKPRDQWAHRPPKRRRRPAYSARACRRCRSPKSGQSVSTNTSSV